MLKYDFLIFNLNYKYTLSAGGGIIFPTPRYRQAHTHTSRCFGTTYQGEIESLRRRYMEEKRRFPTILIGFTQRLRLHIRSQNFNAFHNPDTPFSHILIVRLDFFPPIFQVSYTLKVTPYTYVDSIEVYLLTGIADQNMTTRS